MSKDDDIRGHRRIKISEVNVLKRLNLSQDECKDEKTLRRFCASNNQTLPDMIEVVVSPAKDEDEIYAWKVTIFENPNAPEEASA